MERIYDTVIIGGGPGGYSAALYAARAGMSTLVLEKLAPGGQMAQSHMIDNYPGFDEGIDGFSLAEKMANGARRFGAETRLAEVTGLELLAQPKKIVTDSGTVLARTVVLATGAGPRLLGVPGEAENAGAGVHYCAACDGFFYRGKTVVVVGGGNSAAADALLLSRVAKKVILVHRRDTLRATKIYHQPIMDAENVEKRWNRGVKRILAEDGAVVGVELEDLISGQTERIACDAVFVSIGRKPASDLVKGIVPLDDNGYVIADESTRTAIDGVFAIGDLRTKALRQVITAAADGAVAIHYAQEAVSGDR